MSVRTVIQYRYLSDYLLIPAEKSAGIFFASWFISMKILISQFCVGKNQTNIAVRKQKGADMTMLDEYGDVLTIADLQEILSIGRNTAYSMIQNGIIPAVRVGRKKWRISKQAVIRYLDQEKK